MESAIAFVFNTFNDLISFFRTQELIIFNDGSTFTIWNFLIMIMSMSILFAFLGDIVGIKRGDTASGAYRNIGKRVASMKSERKIRGRTKQIEHNRKYGNS